MELGGPGRLEKQKTKTAVPSRVNDSFSNLIYSFLKLIHSCMNDGVGSQPHAPSYLRNLFFVCIFLFAEKL